MGGCCDSALALPYPVSAGATITLPYWSNIVQAGDEARQQAGMKSAKLAANVVESCGDGLADLGGQPGPGGDLGGLDAY